MSSAPFLLVRARIRPSRLEEFRVWHAAVHVPHVLAIPGITSYRRLTAGPEIVDDGPNHASLFFFRDENLIQRALSSPEAERARRDWESWAADTRDLSISIFAQLDTRPLLRHLN